MNPIYKRILLKLSGESLAGDLHHGIDFNIAQGIAKQIKLCVDKKIQVGIVIGGGNFWRGRSSGKMDRTKADQMGMLATVMNALALADVFESTGIETKVETALSLQNIAEPFSKEKTIKYLNEGKVVIFACGIGHPFFSTDTAAALRAAEIEADVILKATMVDGVYNCDPKTNKDAVKYGTLSFDTILKDNLKIIDSTAASLCKDNNISLLVFSILNYENIFKAAMGNPIGTIIKGE